LIASERLIRIRGIHVDYLGHAQIPGERLLACYNQQLAEQRRHKRQELLAATQTELEALAASVGRPAGRREKAADIGVRAGKIINHYKMAKHFELIIRDGHLARIFHTSIEGWQTAEIR
jgi:hypothetical protein